MTSPRKHAANRRNARNSTGPRSERGKARAALNAVTHGLSGRPLLDTKSQEAIQTLACAVAGEGADHPRVLELACQAAEAQIQFDRVKEARSRVWEEAGRDGAITDQGLLFGLAGAGNVRRFRQQTGLPVGDLKKVLPNLFKAPLETDLERDMAVLELASKRLSGLVRYERRAAKMRDRAFRELATFLDGITG